MTLLLRSDDPDIKFNIISEFKEIRNIYEAKIKNCDENDKQEYILKMWKGYDYPFKSEGIVTVTIQDESGDWSDEYNYNINVINSLECSCCQNTSITSLNKPPLNLLKINFYIKN
jgi:hypothetical protein